VELEGHYNGGLKDGEWKKYDAGWKVIEKLFYVEGKQEK
jgi:antitoxin component YwqK of YwqJK toxin-antitoxin module